MYGSDWPVCELAGGYERVHAALRDALGTLSNDDSFEIFEGTARRFYQITN
jgi:L-fuconolactonase